ncbi:CHRD domain-containing protein [Alteribacillus bidgolensis]|uniref:CHRD domain-containing protein n=1 Tax=Alteribacillus bidgolensis TaxID=930129 RepID=A0A1G8RI89_9BACI|nr:CHRD domain-containing protein [Alteribacillus bidgolensis]SDJ16774.1 CHRD domain-containing protein [Alteribacillus bidgolensis]
MEKFIAELRGQNEVPPVKTDAFGVAKFLANEDGTKIKFELEVNNIRNFIQAHIHFGARDENGPVLVFLFGADLATLEDQNGITTRRGVVTGVITDKDIVPNDAGVKNVNDLLILMRKELTYVNAHTEQNPGGEIRGQIIPLRNRY